MQLPIAAANLTLSGAMSTSKKPKKINFLKRGHNAEYSLSRGDLDALIATTTSKTKAILILLRHGCTVREMIAFQAATHLSVESHPQGNTYWLAIRPSLIAQLSKAEHDYLSLYPEGFTITGVSIWRRIKKAISRANDEYVIYLPDPARIPFPAALRIPKEHSTKELLPRLIAALRNPANVRLWYDEAGVEHCEVRLDV